MKHLCVEHQNYHLQGFSSGGGYMYWSFTDSLVKTTLNGTMRAQVQIYGGHLGDCDYHDGKIYASYMKNALPGHEWGDWEGFCIYVFDAVDLHIIDIYDLKICDEYKKMAGKDGDVRGFRGIDGVTFAPDPVTGETKMFVACAVITGEKYSSQIILQLTTDGVYETEYYVPTGNTVFGIQNLDYDSDAHEFWFSTYGGPEPYMPKETLFCVSGDFKRILRKYQFSTPYGIDCLGGGEFYASIQYGVNGDRGGLAYLCSESFFDIQKTEQEVEDYVRSQL